MSNPIAIRAEQLSKLYWVGTSESYMSIRDSFSKTVRSFFSRTPNEKNKSIGQNQFWALKDVTFELEKGQALGIIGANGAGKSTLLKILSRITVPTRGYAEIHGRMGSLLEVGTGFHPELSGRDNIFLSGIILGMKRAEINQRFDEIVAFAEMSRFIDTPVKHYSSGMYVRLAFSVAAHLNVDVLAIDEVLAVGDASFQKKCLSKMDETMNNQGRTILFVSHNLGAVKHLTNKCLLLSYGSLTKFDRTEIVVNTYLQENLVLDGGGTVDLTHPDWRRGTGKHPELNITFCSIGLQNDQGRHTSVFFEQDAINVELKIQSKIDANSAEIIVVIMSFEGTVLLSAFSRDKFKQIREGVYKARCRFHPNPLRSGLYRVRLYLKSSHWQDVIAEAVTFKVELNPEEEEEISYAVTNPGIVGLIRAQYQWAQIERV